MPWDPGESAAMTDAHEILGLKPDASERELRQRYLELVRAYPPDRAPERFAAVHRAYEALSDPARRVAEQIFMIETKNDSFEMIAADLCDRLRDARLPVQLLLDLADFP
jgi:preprotein translocase subunit Sec63